MSEPTKILHCGVQDEALKEILAADAEERGASINDLAVGILASRFGVDFVGSGRKSPGFRGSAVGAYRMPVSLWNAIDDENRKRERRGLKNRAKKEIVAEVLAEHYGLALAA